MNLIYLVLGLASFALYFPMESRKVKGHYLETELDKRIPMIPEFVVPYILFFPYIFGVFIWAFFASVPQFSHLAISLILVSVTTTVIYVGFPTKMMRPFRIKTRPAYGLSEKMIKAIQIFDKPNNVFPSNHVAYSLVVTLFLVATFPAWTWTFWTIFTLIAASTVLIKQHYLIDVPSGVALALLIWYVVGYLI